MFPCVELKLADSQSLHPDGSLSLVLYPTSTVNPDPFPVGVVPDLYTCPYVVISPPKHVAFALACWKLAQLGAASTVTTTSSVSVQPLPSVAVTVYVVVLV